MAPDPNKFIFVFLINCNVYELRSHISKAIISYFDIFKLRSCETSTVRTPNHQQQYIHIQYIMTSVFYHVNASGSLISELIAYNGLIGCNNWC